MIILDKLSMMINGRLINCDAPLSFKEGSFTFIKGPSGSGKTTLSYILAMLSKQEDYEYYYFNERIKNDVKRDNIRKSEIGFLFQNFNMLEYLTLEENLRLFASLNSTNMSIDQMTEILKKVRLDLELNRLFSTLSGGEKQRFCLACILAKDPKVIIADEPTSALDNTNADILMNVLYELKKDKIIIVSTHTNRYDSYADNIITLSSSKILQSNQGKLNNVKRNIQYKKTHITLFLLMIKHRLKRLLSVFGKHLFLIMIMISLSLFLFLSGEASISNYNDLINKEIDNCLFITKSNYYAPALTQEDIHYINKIPNVKNIYQIPLFMTSLYTSDGLYLCDVEIFPSTSPNVGLNGMYNIAVNSSLHHLINENVQIFVNNESLTFHVDDIYDSNKVNLYIQDEHPKIFIPIELFPVESILLTNNYIVEIKDFNSYYEVVNKVNALGKDYSVSSPYYFYFNLLEQAKSQKQYINICSLSMIIIAFILLQIIYVNENRLKLKEISLCEANGLKKVDIVILELFELIFKLFLFFIISSLLIQFYSIIFNHFHILDFMLTLDVKAVQYLIILLIFVQLLPNLVLIIFNSRNKPEDVLRSLF